MSVWGLLLSSIMIVMCVQDITHARGSHDLCPFSSARAHSNYGNGNGRFRRARVRTQTSRSFSKANLCPLPVTLVVIAGVENFDVVFLIQKFHCINIAGSTKCQCHCRGP